LIQALEGRLFRQAYALCRDEAQAQDLAQETLIEAWRSLGRFNGQCQLATWLCSILLHRHKALLRRTRWRALFPHFSRGEQERAAGRLEDHAPAPDQAAHLSDRTRLVLASLDRLPARQREVLFLRFYGDEPLEGIAAALNCSVGTVKSRLFHGLEALRRMSIFRKELR
jgi:RNA polymerase sigma-70 factor (ECF subfamily)